MVLMKCKDCGGVVFKEDALTSKCSTCGKIYDSEYVDFYQEKTNFGSEYATQAKQLFNAMKSSELANLIGVFMIQYAMADEEEQFSASYEVENYLTAFAIGAIKEYGESFGDYPYDTNTVNRFVNVVANVRDVIYAVCKKNEGKLSYEWMMGLLSNEVVRLVNVGLNWGADRWKKYDHEEDSDGWTEYINILSNCQIILDQLDKYGDVCLGFVYNRLCQIEEAGINLTYVHRYWIGDYHASQNIGLAPESKAKWQERLNNYKKKREAFEHKKVELEEKRRREEEARLEAEKQARIEKFWAKNKDLKKQLLSEKEECEAKIEKLEAKRDGINADKEISELKEEIQIANSTLASLGLFALKEKKAKKEQIAQLNREIYLQKDKVNKAKEEVQKEIDSIKNRIEEIENEFIIDRQ